MILAGDLGGTKANLGAFEMRQGKLQCLKSRRYASHEYARAEDVVSAFAREAGGKFTAACFGVAGPVVDNTVHATNLPWVVDGPSLARQIGIDRVVVLNDLVATGYGLSVLEPAELETIQAGVPEPRATKAVIAAGTGLGEGILFWDGARHLPMACEAGHADFAPRTDPEIELLRSLRAKYGRAEVEMVLSGRGFREIHEILDRSAQHASFEDPEADPAPEITRLGLEGSCPVCVRTLDLWVEIYGAEAGNLALRAVARGGVYVAGGIAVKILPKLKDGRFTKAFADKGKLSAFLARISIFLVLNENAPLLGAAYVAAQPASASR